MKYLYLICFSALISSSLYAQYGTSGLYINLNGNVAALRYEENDWQDQAEVYGFGFRMGYGLSPVSTLFLTTSVQQVMGNPESAFREDYKSREFGLGGRFHLGRDQHWLMPYAEVTAQYVAAAPYENVKSRGGGLTLAPGLLVFFSEQVALDASLRFSGTYVYDTGRTAVDNLAADDPYSLGEARFQLGMSFYPSVRRSRYPFERR